MKSRTIQLGTSAVLECIVSGNPRPNIKWFKDGQPLATDSYSQTKQSNELLVLFSFQHSNEGVYSCQATNSLGTVTQMAELTVDTGAAGDRRNALPSHVFVTVIVMTVVGVVVLTSLVWLALICCFKRRRRRLELDALNKSLVLSPPRIKDPYLSSDLPKEFVLKCNGRLVPPKSLTTPISDEALDPLIEDVRNFLIEQQGPTKRETSFTYPRIGGDIRQINEAEDDSGVALIYPKYTDDDPLHCCHQQRSMSTPSEVPSDRTKHRRIRYPSNKNENTDISSDSSHSQSCFLRHESVDSDKNCYPLNSGYPGMRSSLMYPSSSSDYNLGEDPSIENFSHIQENSSDSLPVNNNLGNNCSAGKIDYDPTRLKIMSGMKCKPNRTSSRSLLHVSNLDKDYYPSYVTSSSGIESGGSSSPETVSLNNVENSYCVDTVAV